jgi:hypothetical protein
MKPIRIALWMLTAGVPLATGWAAQTVPPLVNYQGLLVNSDNSPLANGMHPVQFRIYDQITGGNLIWGPQSNIVAAFNGQFNVLLGPTDGASRPLADAFKGASRYLELQVSNSLPISPRQQILSAPFALNAQTLNGTNWGAVFDNADPATGKIPGSMIGEGSITSSQIADGTIQQADLGSNCVTSAKIVDGAIQQADLGSIYRLSASDGNPANALQMDASGNATFSGSITATGAVHGSNLSADNLSLVGQYISNPNTPATIDLGFLYNSGGLKTANIRIAGVNTFLYGPGLLIECDTLAVTNLLSSGSSSSAYPLYYHNTTHQIFKLTSSARYKTAIEPLRQDFSSILTIEPKVYVRKGQPGIREVGYLAEDLDKAGLKDVTIYDAEGRPDGIDYARLVIYSNEVLKEHRATIKKQQEELAALRAEMEALKKLVNQSR